MTVDDPQSAHSRALRAASSTSDRPDAQAAARRAVVDWALSHVGVTKSSAGSAAIDAWQSEFGLHDVNWCGCFVGYALRIEGAIDEIDGRVVLVPCVLEDARAGVRGWTSLVAAEKATAGDAVLYCWDGSGVPSHIGLVVSNDVNAQVISAVEGNTTSGDEGDQARGGGVFLRERPYSAIVGCAVPRYCGR